MSRPLPLLIGTLAAALLAAGAGAVDREELLRCAAIASDVERLACYDALGERSAREPPPAPAEPIVQTTPEERFGLGPQGAGEPDTISATILRATPDPLGRVTFVLDNGQRWKQADDRRVDARGLAERGATITRGAVGSYWLKPEDGRRVRVRRVD